LILTVLISVMVLLIFVDAGFGPINYEQKK